MVSRVWGRGAGGGVGVGHILDFSRQRDLEVSTDYLFVICECVEKMCEGEGIWLMM